MKAVILAAGKGTRINTGSIILPKPLYMVGRRQLIEHIILNFKQAGIRDFIIVVGFMSEHIKYYLRNGESLGVNIKYVYNADFGKDKDGLSTYVTKKELRNEDFILSVANHIIAPEVIKALIKIKTSGCVLAVDTKLDKINNVENAIKVLMSDTNLLEWGSSIKKYNAIDCGIFRMNPKIFSSLGKAFKQGRYTLRDGIVCLKNVNTLDIKDNSWVSVNARSDLSLAEEVIEQQGWRDND